MADHTFDIKLRGNSLHVHQFGEGPEMLLLFHGFGESGEKYTDWARGLGEEYTLFVPDLPFHGETRWHEEPLHQEDLLFLVRTLWERSSYHTCRIIGYSMGGRLALLVGHLRKNFIQQLLLIAPEGIRQNKWFGVATQSWPGRQLFRLVMIRHPEWMIRLLRVIKRLNLVNARKIYFVEKLMREEDGRMRVYRTWMCLRRMPLRRRHKDFRGWGVKLLLVFGKDDSLIPEPTASERRRWHPAKVVTLPFGHALFMDPKSRERLVTLLK